MTIIAEDILGSKSSIRVLRVLSSVSVALSITQIAQQAHMTRPAAVTVLERLEAAGIVFMTRSGNTRLYQIEPANIYVKEIIKPLFLLEQDLLGFMIEDITQTLKNLSVAIILFGSFARGEQSPSSDVDIFVVAKNVLGKRQIEVAIDDYSLRFYRRFGHSLEALVYDVVEASELPTRAPILFAELKEDGKIISGATDWISFE